MCTCMYTYQCMSCVYIYLGWLVVVKVEGRAGCELKRNRHHTTQVHCTCTYIQYVDIERDRDERGWRENIPDTYIHNL